MDPASLDPREAVRLIEDYKPLDVESATMALALFRGMRERYPEWRFVLDGDGGDENLKDYPIEENPELTIRSVVNNLMLYQEGWGVGSLKHSETYTGGQSRSCARTYAPPAGVRLLGLQPVHEAARDRGRRGHPVRRADGRKRREALRAEGRDRLRGVRAITGFAMPVFPKRRFQHGAGGDDVFARRFGYTEAQYRAAFLSRYLGAA